MKKFLSVFLTTGAFFALSYSLIPNEAKAGVIVTSNPCVNGKVTIGRFYKSNGLTTVVNVAYHYSNSMAEAAAYIFAFNSTIPNGATSYYYLDITCNSTGVTPGVGL